MSSNVLSLPQGREEPRGRPLPAEQSGPAVVSLLRQAADAAKRNEDRAKLMVQQLAEEVRAAQNRIRMLEADLRQYQDRAEQAERWLMHIHDQIQDALVTPLTDGEAGRTPARRSRLG